MSTLHIIHKSTQTNNGYEITVTLVDDHHQTYSESSVITVAEFIDVQNRLRWYYNDYLLKPFGHAYKEAQAIVHEISKLGQSLYNQIIVDTLKTALQKVNLSGLSVNILSESSDFFDLPWETLQVSGQKEPLSTQVKSFVRQKIAHESPEIHHGLGPNNPLRLLWIAPRPNDCLENPLCASPDAIIHGLLEFNTAIDIEILSCPQFSQLQARLEKASENPIHIIHFNGYIAAKSATLPDAGLVFETDNGESETISSKKIAALLSKQDIQALFLDVAPHRLTEHQSIEYDISAPFASALINQGFANVVSTAFGDVSVYAERFYHVLYSMLGSGKSLAQSVVDTRAVVNSHSSQAVFTCQELEFCDWPLFTHYCNQDVVFFSEPITPAAYTENKNYQYAMNQAIGFKKEILSAGFLGRYHQRRVIENAFDHNKAVLISGNHGVGKTALAHHVSFWHLFEKKSARAFYFDFDNTLFTKTTLLQIMAEIFNKEAPNINAVMDTLSQEKHLFVFDNLEKLNNSEKIIQDDVFSFINELIQKDCRIILVSTLTKFDAIKPIETICLKGLNPYDRRQFGCSILRRNKLTDSEETYGYYDLLDSLEGHPYLTETLLVSLTDTDPLRIASQFKEKLQGFDQAVDVFSNQAILALFDYGWTQCPENSRRILYAFKDLSGYLTEGMIIAIDRPDNRNLKQELYTLIDVPFNQKLSDAFLQACKIGLYSKKEFGYEIHNQAREFLRLKAEDTLWDAEKSQKIQVAVNKLFVLELKLLVAFLSQHTEPKLLQKIIENIPRWLNALNALWQGAAYDAFFTGKRYLSNILMRVGLKSTIDEWALSQLKQADLQALIKDKLEGGILAWLQLASECLDNPVAVNDETIITNVEYWRAHLSDEHTATQFNGIMMFLESYYRKKEDWLSRESISEAAINYYKNIAQYEKMAIAMRSLAHCKEALGHLDECNAIEEKLLNDIPFDSLRSGFKQEIMLNIANRKIQRNIFDEALNLIQAVKAMPPLEGVDVATDMIYADLLFKQEKFAESLAIYAALWNGLMKGKHQMDHRIIAIRLKKLSELLGDEQFSSIYKIHAPDVKSPQEMEAERVNQPSVT